MKKDSNKVLWNVFLFVICGGSLIYSFVQQQRMVESKVQMEKCQQQVDSLKTTLERMNEQMKIGREQIRTEGSDAESAK